MQTLEKLYHMALAFSDSWEESGAVDWNDADQLTVECACIPDGLLAKLPEIQQIVDYASEHEDWDSGEAGNWPAVIRATIEGYDKEYAYKADSENWEVYSTSLTGEVEWKATVETETIAERLVQILSTS